MKRAASLDLYHALTVASDALAEGWDGAGVASFLAWGEPAEIEVVYCRGFQEEVCHALSDSAGRRIVEALRRRGEAVLVREDRLGKDARDLRAALKAGGVAGLLLVPLPAGPGALGVVCLELSRPDLDAGRGDDVVALALVDQVGRTLKGLSLAASSAALAVALAEDHGPGAQRLDGIVVLDRWERVLFSFGLPERVAGWQGLGPFGRSADLLPGGDLLAKVPLSRAGDLRWEEHLLPPSESDGSPMALAAVPFAQRGEDEHGRVVLFRDLRAGAEEAGESPLLDLALRVASDSEAVAGLTDGIGDGPDTPMARRFDAYRTAVVHQTAQVDRTVREAVRRSAGTGEVPAADLNALLERILHGRERELLAEGVRILRFLRPELTGVAAGDPVELQQILAGLLDHARESLRPGGGTLTVRTWEEKGEVYLAVSDDGRGVGSGGGLEAFQPLYTELDPGHRSERFLDEARARIAPWEGRLMVESRPGLWNRITLMLPGTRRDERASKGKTRPVARELPPAVEVRKGEEGLEVLVVDDNPSLRSVMRRYLERRGHKVTEAEDGAAALAALGKGRFDRVVVDVRMPGTDGPTFFRTLDDVAPQMRERTIFMTGGFLEQEVESFIVSTGRPSIQKPFDLSEMARTVEA